MNILGKMIQGNVCQIGASVGVVLEVNCPNPREAARLREMLLIILETSLEANGFSGREELVFENMEAESFEKAIGEIINKLVSSE